jgi:hypothetical protein
VPEPCTYDYAVIRVVPRVERAEFVNAGVIVSCPSLGLLEARIEVDPARLRALDPALDLELVARHLATIPLICAGGEAAGPIGRLAPRERFHWLTAPRSTIIQCSPVHTGQCRAGEDVLERLLETMVRVPKAAAAGARPSGRST